MKLTIITINLNNRQGLEKTVKSVVSQTYYEQIEYVVIDGASVDGSAEFLCGYKNLLTFISEPDNGIYNAMNKGIKLAKGDFLLFLNSGDALYDSTVIEDIYPHLDEDVDLLIGRLIDKETKESTPYGYEVSLFSLYKLALPHPSTFIKKSEMIKFMYDESYKIASDWKFFIQSIVLDNCTYKWMDRVVALFDHFGVSSSNADIGQLERASILNELFPPRLLTDYATFINGQGYTNTDYDNFFLEFRPFKCGKLMYSFCVTAMKILSCFLSTAKKARKYPSCLFSNRQSPK